MNLDEFDRQLRTQLKALLHRTDVRIVAIVPIGDDEILRERLASSCAGIAHPVIAVFEAMEGPEPR
jgi:hypothetical protein